MQRENIKTSKKDDMWKNSDRKIAKSGETE